MKRCPQCNRVDIDDALGFGRVDGAALVIDPASLNSEAGTAKLSSASAATAMETSIFPHRTDAANNRSTGPTAALLAKASRNHERYADRPACPTALLRNHLFKRR